MNTKLIQITLSALTCFWPTAIAQVFDKVVSFTDEYPIGDTTPNCLVDGTNSLLEDSDGTIYGSAYRSYFISPTDFIEGRIYRISEGGIVKKLHEFAPNASGEDVMGTIQLWGTDGRIYGISGNGGASGAGTLFRIGKDDSAFTSLVEFTGNNGSFPARAPTLLAQAADFSYVGITSAGGESDPGTVFRYGGANEFQCIAQSPGTSEATSWTAV